MLDQIYCVMSWTRLPKNWLCRGFTSDVDTLRTLEEPPQGFTS